MHIKQISFLIIFIIVLTNTANAKEFKIPNELGPKGFNYDLLDSYINSKDETIVSGFMADSKYHSSNLQLSYYMKNSGNFTGDFLIANYTRQSVSYSVVCLLDYVQIKCDYKNKASLSQDITLASKQRNTIAVNIQHIKPGAHDFIIAAARTDVAKFKEFDPKNARIPDYGVLAHRANIFVSNNNFTKTQYRDLDETINNNGMYTQLVINKANEVSDFGALKKTYWELSNNQDFNFHVSNYTEEKIPYALVLFANSKQVPLSVKDNNKVIFYTQKKQSAGIIPFRLSSNESPKKLWALVIDNPYSILEPNHGHFSKKLSNIRISNTILFN